ncbi:MAG TPA: capsule assembly Wzi family protein, partial [Acidobacteriaceae bacterium]
LDPVTNVYTNCDQPITLHTFFKSFFSFSDTTIYEKYSRDDPGARFSAFTFSYRLPFLRKYVTLYTDSIAHDDVTPPSAPRRAAYRPGIYLSHFPHLEKLDLRAEASSTDTSTLRSLGGQFNYYETVQRQGYTNKGYIMGDWIGREAKGGNAWLTYHLSGDEWVQLQYMNKKTPKDFIPEGTTQNQFTVDVVKNLRKDIQLNAWMQYERWKAPLYKVGQQNDVVVAAQIKFFPALHTRPEPATNHSWWH